MARDEGREFSEFVAVGRNEGIQGPFIKYVKAREAAGGESRHSDKPLRLREFTVKGEGESKTPQILRIYYSSFFQLPPSVGAKLETGGSAPF